MARVSILLTDGVRLANKLYMHAAVLAWCLESGHTLIDPCMYPYARHFPSLRGNLLCSPHHRLPVGPFLADTCRLGRLTWFLTRGLGKLGLLGRPISPPRGDWNPVLLPPSGPEPSPSARAYAILRWGMQNHLGMVKHHEAITRHLAPLPSIVRDADTFAAALPPGRPAIGVHIRHGDYRTALQGWYFVPLGDTVREMHRFRDALADLNPVFVIFSDEPRTAAEFPGLDVVISSAPAINDLYRMARLPLIIGPMSSFNLWAAYAGGGLAYQFGASPEGLAAHRWLTYGLPATSSFDDALAALRARLTRPYPPRA